MGLEGGSAKPTVSCSFWSTAGPDARVARESGQGLTAAAISGRHPVPSVSWPSTRRSNRPGPPRLPTGLWPPRPTQSIAPKTALPRVVGRWRTTDPRHACLHDGRGAVDCPRHDQTPEPSRDHAPRPQAPQGWASHLGVCPARRVRPYRGALGDQPDDVNAKAKDTEGARRKTEEKRVCGAQSRRVTRLHMFSFVTLLKPGTRWPPSRAPHQPGRSGRRSGRGAWAG